MMKDGTFTHIIHPHNETLFENANIDVIIFRYCKNNSLSNKILVNNDEKYLINSNGILTFSDKEQNNMKLFSEYFSKQSYDAVFNAKFIFKNNLIFLKFKISESKNPY